MRVPTCMRNVVGRLPAIVRGAAVDIDDAPPRRPRLDQKSSVRRPHSDEPPSRTVRSKGVIPNSLPLLSTLIDLLAVRRLTA